MASLISSDIALLYYMTVTYIITYKKKGNPIEGNQNYLHSKFPNLYNTENQTVRNTIIIQSF